MVSLIAARRLEILAAARARRGEFLHLDHSRFRFSLGTSIGEFRLPLEVAPDASAIVVAAARELALLLATQHRFVPSDERERIVRAAGELPVVVARLGPTGGGPDLRAAASLGAAVHPALNGGVLCAWMGPGGRGRSLVGLVIEVAKRALAEMADTGHREPTPVVAALALHAELAACEPRIRELLPPALDRYLGAAAMAGVWVAARAGLRRAWRDAGRPVADPLLDEIEVALSPGVLLGLRAPRPGGDLLYGCEIANPLPRADELAGMLAAGSDPDAALAALARAISADEDLARRAEQALALAAIRDHLREAVERVESDGAPDRVASLRDLLAAPGALSGACLDDAGRKELQRALGGLGLTNGGAEHVEAAALALRSWRAREPAAAVGLSRDQAVAEFARAGGALVADMALERLAAPLRRAVGPPAGPASVPDAEWQAGRLYRIATRGPILRSGSERPLGHLFADVKDFTRRTGFVGTAAVAELLRTEFYSPILAAARPFRAGTAHLGEEGAVTVNNLLGDAISVSGEIQGIVGLSLAVRRTLASYEARLAREVSRDVVARQLQAIEARHAREIEPVRRAAAAVRADLARAQPGDPAHARLAARAAWLASREAELGSDHERELARARGEGLEAGVFIAYGPPPLAVTIEDPVFGRNRVAIGEKINESARGTARSPASRARADAELAAERAARGNPGLQHAWSVFVDRPLVVGVPAAEAQAAVDAARAGDLAGAMRALAIPVRAAIEETLRAGDDPAGDVYNSGAALSQEALEAFLAAAGPSRTVRRVELDPKRIPEALRARWFFGTRPLQLVAAFHADGRRAELFRRAGVARFKGLDDVVVWEIGSETGGPAALFQALGPEWARGT